MTRKRGGNRVTRRIADLVQNEVAFFNEGSVSRAVCERAATKIMAYLVGRAQRAESARRKKGTR